MATPSRQAGRDARGPAFARGLLAVAALGLTACAGMQPVSIEIAMRQPPPAGVDYGSLVEVKTLDGRSTRFRVTEMDEEGLGGKPGFYRYEDMARLEVQRPRREGEAASWILGLLGVVAVIAVIDSADSVSVCSSPPCPQP